MKKLTINELKTFIREVVCEDENKKLPPKKVKTSAGILLWRPCEYREEGVEVLLALPGGPFYVGKDLGAWGIPKGELEEGEDPKAAAFREFAEETGSTPKGKPVRLPDAKLKSGKTIHAWAVRGDLEPGSFSSNTFDLEWPKGSGKIQSFPEIAQVAWFGIDEAKVKIFPAQGIFIDALVELLTKVSGNR